LFETIKKKIKPRKKLNKILYSLSNINIKLLLFKFQIKKTFFGMDNASLMLNIVPKNVIIPLLKRYNSSIGRNCDIESNLLFHNIDIKDYSNLSIGNNCHIGKNCFFDLRDKIIIKNNVTISMGCSFITHIDVGKSKLFIKYPPEKEEIFINSNVYIGANSTLLMGISVGVNSFIAAGSVVTKDVEPYTMVGGVPAKLIKKLNKADYQTDEI